MKTTYTIEIEYGSKFQKIIEKFIDDSLNAIQVIITSYDKKNKMTWKKDN